MSTTIDNRVVEMQFDNKQFERNVATSMTTLDKLKQSLNLTGAAKGLESVNSAARDFNSTGLGTAVESVSTKFSALQVMGVTALANITNSAVNAGKRLASAFTIDPIKTGLSEYETQINAVQTILANTESKGTTLEDVNNALDVLNKYADKTIYNFTEMTRNIGTFTAAGTDLDTSVNAIQGIANLAAVSGSNSQQASTAMYQLSQALASGTVKLMDWNSVVNAGMGGQVFQDALKETARVHGIAIDSMIEEEGSFRETLQKGWLTSEILTETLAKFTMATEGLTEAEIEKNRAILKGQGYTDEQIEGIFKLGDTATNAATKVKTFTQLMETLKEAAQSGWTQTWELLIGDFEEAKELWTSVSDVFGGFINSTSEARNTLLGGALNSNWEKLTDEINEAGISTTDFENKIRDVAEAHNIDVDKMIEEHGSLAEAFKSGAISSDILQEAVNGLKVSFDDLLNIERELSKGTSGDDVKQVQEALKALNYDLGSFGTDGIFGAKTEEAVKAFQKANNMEVTGVIDQTTLEALDSAAKKTNTLTDSVDELISGITELGGRELLIESLKNIFEGFVNVLKPIKDAFREVFPPATSEQLYSLIERFGELSEKFKAFTDDQGPNIKATFKGIFSVLGIGVDFIKAVGNGIVRLLSNFTGLSGGILNATGSLGNWLSGLRDSIKEAGIFGAIVDKIVDFLQKGIDKIKEFTDSLVWENFYGFLSKIGETIGKIASSLGKSIGDIITNGDLQAGMATINTGIFGGILFGVKKYIDGITAAFDGVGIIENVRKTFDSVRESLTAWQQNLKASILLKIAGAIGILAASLFVIAMTDSEKLVKALGAITVLFIDLVGSLAIFDKMGGAYAKAGKAATVMIGISVAVFILASALKKIAGLEWEEIAKGLVGVGVLTGIVVAAAKVMSKGTGEIMKGAVNLVIFAAAIKILASACEDLSALDWDELTKGLAGVGILMAEVAAFLNLTKNSKNSIGTATGVVILAAGIKILASACKDFGTMEWEEIGKGLASIGALLLEVAIFTKLTGNAKHVISTAASLVIIGGALKIFASAVSDFAAMSWGELARGLFAMGVALAEVTVAVNLMPKNIISVGVGLIAIAYAISMLAESLGEMGRMSWEETAKGLVALGGSMLILAIGLNAMKGSLAGAAALLVASAALAVFAPVITTLGEMTWGEIARGLIAIAGAFTVIGIAGYLLAPIVPSILLLSVALLAIGAGCTLAGVGLSALAIAFTSLSASLVVAASSIVGAIVVIAVGLGEIIVAACESIIAAAPSLAEAFVALIKSACYAITESLPVIAEALLSLLVDVLQTLKTYIPQLVDVVMDILIGLLDALAPRMPELATSGARLVSAFIDALGEAFGKDGLDNLIKSIECVAGVFIALGITAKIISTIPIAGALQGVASLGIVVGGIAAILAALGGLAQIPGFTWLIGEGAEVLGIIGTAIGTFVGNIVSGLAEGITSSLPQVGSNLSGFMTNAADFIEGAKTIDGSVLEGVGTLAGAIIAITAADVISGIASFLTGGSSIASFGEELGSLGSSLKSFSDNVAGMDATTVTAAVTAAKGLAEMASIIPNEGGVAAWFAGENSLANFGPQMADFGIYLKQFSDNVAGVNGESMIAAATAGKALAEMASVIPNEGGLAAWFTGDNSLANFGPQIASFGLYLRLFAMNVAGIDAASVIAAADAAKALASMADTIPNEGGVAAWFAGENSLANFGSQIAIFGLYLRLFSANVAGIDIEAVRAATDAGVALANMADIIPNEGGVAAWFTGENSLANFGLEIAIFGSYLKMFSDNVAGIDVAAVSSATAAGVALAGLADTIPNEGGVVGWFSGENSLASFGADIASFGGNLKLFSDNVAGINVANVMAAAMAGKALASMAEVVPSEGGVKAWWSGEKSISSFGSKIADFGTHMKSFSDNVAGLNAENVSVAANAGRSLADMTKSIPEEINLSTFGAQLKTLGTKISEFLSRMTGVDVSDAVAQVKKIIALAKELNGVDTSKISGLGQSLKQLGNSGVDGFIKAFTDGESRVTTAINKLLEAALTSISGKQDQFHKAAQALTSRLNDGFKSQKDASASAVNVVANACLSKVRGRYWSFYYAGQYVIDGFAYGITAKKQAAIDAAADVASAALAAAKAIMRENSPSKAMYEIGAYGGEGFINAFSDYESESFKAGAGIASSAITGLQDAIRKAKDIVENGIDSQPTIRPVLDLSDLTSNASKISSLFDMSPSVGVMANVGAISSGMRSRQNGSTNDDVISAIKDLKSTFDNMHGDTYNVNGITYEDDSAVAGAIQTLVRASKIGRRT